MLARVIVGPKVAFESLADAPAWKGAVPMTVLGLVYAGFSFALGYAGHTPAQAILPIPLEAYYFVQAALLPPLFVVLWGIVATVVRLFLGGGAAAALGWAYAVPWGLAYVGPDIAVYLVAGFDALAPAMRWFAPVAVLWTWALTAPAVRVVHRRGWGASIAVAFVALLAQAMVGGVVLR